MVFIKDFKKCDFTKIYMWNLQEREQEKNRSALKRKRGSRLSKQQQRRNIAGQQLMAGVKGLVITKSNRLVYFVDAVSIPRWVESETHNARRYYNQHRQGAKVPEPLSGHRWKQVIHNDTVTWLCGWNDTINTKDWKYVQLAPPHRLRRNLTFKNTKKRASLNSLWKPFDETTSQR